MSADPWLGPDLGMVFSRIAHDLRNPLSGLSMGIDLLERDASIEAQHLDTLAEMRKALEDLFWMSSNLEELAKLDGCADAPESFAGTDIDGVVRGAMSRLEASHGRNRMSFRSCPVGLVRGGRGMLERVVENLLRVLLRRTLRGRMVDIAIDVSTEGLPRLIITGQGPHVREAETGRVSLQAGLDLGLAMTHASRVSVLTGGTFSANVAEDGLVTLAFVFRGVPDRAHGSRAPRERS